MKHRNELQQRQSNDRWFTLRVRLPRFAVSRRLLLIGLTMVVLGFFRLSVPAFSAPVTPTATTKAAVYSGVMSIVSTTACGAEYCVLELGNAGRDIASNGEIFIRPNASDAGTKFYNDYNGKCSTDGLPCMSDGDCSGSQSCIGSQSLLVTGNLTIAPGKSLCFNANCNSTWPVGGGVNYWAELTSGGFTSLKPVVGGGDALLYVGEPSRCTVSGNICTSMFDCYEPCDAGFCRVSGTPCGSEFDCPNTQCLSGGGVSGKPALEVNGNFSPLVNVTSEWNIGERDADDIDADDNRYESLGTGNVDIIGSLNAVQSLNVFEFDPGRPSATCGFNPDFGRCVPVWDPYNVFDWNWHFSTADDFLYTGSQADADTFDSAYPVPFTSAPFKDVKWKTYYYAFFNDPPGQFVEDYERRLCINAAKPTPQLGYCTGGTNAGLPCNVNTDCPSWSRPHQTCVASSCAQTGEPCIVDNDCPPQYMQCQELCLSTQKSCLVDNIYHCQRVQTVCEDSNIPCSGPADCNPGVQCLLRPGSDQPCRTCRLKSYCEFSLNPCNGPADCDVGIGERCIDPPCECPSYYECQGGPNAGRFCRPVGFDDCVGRPCVRIREGCVADTTFSCRNNSMKSCSNPGDCTAPEVCTYGFCKKPCTIDGDCTQPDRCMFGHCISDGKSCKDDSQCTNADFCNDGDEVTYTSTSSTCFDGGSPGCAETCRATIKSGCDGAGSGRCSLYGTEIVYSNGRCTDLNCTNIGGGQYRCNCRCSLNTPQTTDQFPYTLQSVPYLDAKNQPAAGGGDLCSEQFYNYNTLNASGDYEKL